jgi:hypothetical protein
MPGLCNEHLAHKNFLFHLSFPEFNAPAAELRADGIRLDEGNADLEHYQRPPAAKGSEAGAFRLPELSKQFLRSESLLLITGSAGDLVAGGNPRRRSFRPTAGMVDERRYLRVYDAGYSKKVLFLWAACAPAAILRSGLGTPGVRDL